MNKETSFVSLLKNPDDKHPFGHVTQNLYEYLIEMHGTDNVHVSPTPFQEIIGNKNHPEHDPDHDMDDLYDARPPEDLETVLGQGTFHIFPHFSSIERLGAHLILYRIHEGRLQILLQVRGKKAPPVGRFDVSAGGWVDAGDNFVTTIYKEAEEEIDVIDVEFTKHGTLYSKGRACLFYAEHNVESENIHIPDPEEVGGVLWVDFEETYAEILHERHLLAAGQVNDDDLKYTPAIRGATEEFAKIAPQLLAT